MNEPSFETEDPWIDTVIADRYQIVRKLGEGGMCLVYEAKHIKLARQVAIKRLLPTLLGNKEAQQRFEREAEMLAVLHHPNVVMVTDWDRFPDGAYCMVLEYLHGAPMQQRLTRGAMDWDSIGKFGDQTMSVLSLAHRNGITHRDLKPENIFIAIDDNGDESVKLLDFGVSRLKSVDRSTGVNAMLGTPAYMAPEQAQGQSDLIGPWTDVWAMAAILYEMASGRRAYTGASVGDTLMHIIHGRPEPLAGLRPDAPRQFLDLIERSLIPDTTQRIQTIEELRAGVREVLEARKRGRVVTPVAGVPQLTRDSTPIPGGNPPAKSVHGAAAVPAPAGRNRMISLVVIGLVVIIIVAVVLLFVV